LPFESRLFLPTYIQLDIAFANTVSDKMLTAMVNREAEEERWVGLLPF